MFSLGILISRAQLISSLFIWHFTSMWLWRGLRAAELWLKGPKLSLTWASRRFLCLESQGFPFLAFFPSLKLRRRQVNLNRWYNIDYHHMFGILSFLCFLLLIIILGCQNCKGFVICVTLSLLCGNWLHFGSLLQVLNAVYCDFNLVWKRFKYSVSKNEREVFLFKNCLF